jgi:hypothetical protein
VLGLALLGFGSAGYATRSAEADTTPATTSSCGHNVASVGGFVFGNGEVSLQFTVAGGCADVSFVSYTMPNAVYSAADASEQVLVDATSGTFQPGLSTISVKVPNCYFQIDFVYGAPITQLGPAGTDNFYGSHGNLIVSESGGTTSCSAATTSTTTGQTTTGQTTTGQTTIGQTTTTGSTTSTTGTTPTTTTPTTASTPSTTTQTTTTTQTFLPPSSTTGTTTTVPTATTTTQQTTTSAFIPPPQTTTRSTTTRPVPKRPGGGPFKPPTRHRLKRAHPARPSTTPTLPFTGLPLATIFGIGLALLLGGCGLFALTRRRVAGGPVALAGTPFSMPVRARMPLVEKPRDYRVFVPGRGSFASIDDAEQDQLDRRWARLGSRTLGARWRPPAE